MAEELNQEQVADAAAEMVGVSPDGETAEVSETPEAVADEGQPEPKQQNSERISSEPKMVPLAALQETREELKALKAQNAEMAAQMKLWNERSEGIRAKQEAAEQAAAQQSATVTAQAQEKAELDNLIATELGERPNPEEDPLGARDWDRDKRQLVRDFKRDKEIATLRDSINGRDAAREAAQRDQELGQRVIQMREEFKTTHTDYDAALQHVLTVERSAARRAGYNPEQVEQYILGRASELITNNMRIGKNPAEAIYELAQDYGYKPAAAGAAAPAAPAAAAPTVPAAKKQEQRAAGQGVRTLGNGAAAPSDNLPTLEELDRMDQTTFSRRYNKEPGFAEYVDQLMRDAA